MLRRHAAVNERPTKTRKVLNFPLQAHVSAARADVLDALGEAQIASPQDGSNPFVRRRTPRYEVMEDDRGLVSFFRVRNLRLR
jgi:hypothetical protein